MDGRPAGASKSLTNPARQMHIRALPHVFSPWSGLLLAMSHVSSPRHIPIYIEHPLTPSLLPSFQRKRHGEFRQREWKLISPVIPRRRLSTSVHWPRVARLQLDYWSMCANSACDWWKRSPFDSRPSTAEKYRIAAAHTVMALYYACPATSTPCTQLIVAGGGGDRLVHLHFS